MTVVVLEPATFQAVQVYLPVWLLVTFDIVSTPFDEGNSSPCSLVHLYLIVPSSCLATSEQLKVVD